MELVELDLEVELELVLELGLVLELELEPLAVVQQRIRIVRAIHLDR